MFEEYCLYSTTQSLYNIFESAMVDTSITLIFNKQPSGKFFIIGDNLEYQEERAIVIKDDYVLNLKEINPIIEKIEKNQLLLDDVSEIWQGLIAYSGKDDPRIYSSNKKETPQHRKLLYGKDISKYTIDWSGEYLKYGEWLHRPRPAYIYDDEKILVQRIRNPQLAIRLVCTYDNEAYINGTGLSNILIKHDLRDKYELKFILGILWSPLINYWFSYYFIDVNIKPEQLRKIPLPSISKNEQNEIAILVNNILDIKRLDADKDVSKLEKELNNKIYELYGLSAEEIAIVEGK